MAMNSKESYKETFKATSLFGGVQFISIVINIVRSKVVAVILGTTGYGIYGLLQSPLGLIGLVSELGIGASGVRDIVKSSTDGDEIEISKTVKTVKRWALGTGIAGMVIVIVLSPLLSRWTVGNYDYTWAFLLLSVTLLVGSVSRGQSIVLRGLRRLKDTAKVSLWGSLFGLILSVPLYYLYGVNGFVPTLIISAFVGLFLSWYFSRRINIVPVKMSYKESVKQGKGMIELGVLITLSNLAMQAVFYAILLFINNRSGEDTVGLYTAGWSITNQYVGLIFTAMTVDYFPRLLNLQSNRQKMEEAVNQQAEIAILIIAPLMLFYLSCLPIIVKLLLEEEFLSIISFVQWMIPGMLFKTASWALSHVILAKNDNKLFFWSELTFNGIFLILTIVAYILFGLEGIGIAFVLLYILYFIAMYIITKKKYGITFKKNFAKQFMFQFILCLLCFLAVYIKGYPFAYIVGIVIFIISGIYSLKKLDKAMDLKQTLSKFIANYKK
jgi:O-antigen/teichoic acid export membrane protein